MHCVVIHISTVLSVSSLNAGIAISVARVLTLNLAKNPCMEGVLLVTTQHFYSYNNAKCLMNTRTRYCSY